MFIARVVVKMRCLEATESFCDSVRTHDFSLLCAAGVIVDSTSVALEKQGRTLGDQWTWWSGVHHGLLVPIATSVGRFRAALLTTVHTLWGEVRLALWT